MTLTEKPGGGEPARRRRGEVLEHALLDAAWGELIDPTAEGIDVVVRLAPTRDSRHRGALRMSVRQAVR